MANLGALLKQEVTRISRRELKSETASLKKSSSQHRGDIAALKRRVADLEKALARAIKAMPASAAPAERQADGKQYRFSPLKLKKHRERLELSAAEFGKLFGVTGQAIYAWESGTRPQKKHMPAIGALRTLTKTSAREIIAGRQ